MIFVTLGSQKFQFNRLLEAIDKLIENGENQKFFAQIGHSGYCPKYYEYKRFLDREEFNAILERADIVITHGGTGAIIGALKKGKKVIAVPRLAMYGEHIDNHQLQFVKNLNNMGLICECDDINKLDEALKDIKRATFTSYKSSTKEIIASIEEFISKSN